MDSTIKVGMIILLESDLQAAVNFYEKIGFKLKFNLKDKWAEFLIGSVKLALCPTSHPPMERHTGVVLEVDDLMKLKERLDKENIEIIKEPLVAPHGIMASIKDPSGNIIDIYQPTPETLKDFVKQAADQKKENE